MKSNFREVKTIAEIGEEVAGFGRGEPQMY